VLPERRYAAFRVAGWTLVGTALRYGDISPDFRERFVPGAFGSVPTIIPVSLQHDSSGIVAPCAVLADSPRSLDVRACLPEGFAALALVRRGALSRFSIEFHAKAERREARVRVVQRAELTGLALVDRPAYPASGAEVRARPGRTMRATIPSGTDLDCECIGAGYKVRFLTEALADAISEDVAEGREWVAAHGNYRSPLASTSRGTVRARMVGDDAEVEIDLPDSESGRAVLAAAADAGVVVRPFVERQAAESTTDTDDVTVYTKAPIRAFIVSATDRREGWPILVPTPGMDPERRRAASERRRWVWL